MHGNTDLFTGQNTQAPSPASSRSDRMRLLMAQVLSLSDRVASLTAERPGRALSSGAHSPASSRATGAEVSVAGTRTSGRNGGAALEALQLKGLRTSCGKPERVEAPSGAGQLGRASVASLPLAGSELLSPEMPRCSALGAASPPSGAAGVLGRGEQAVASRDGKVAPAHALHAQLPPARTDGAPLHDRSAAAARRILDCLGIGYDGGRCAAAFHHFATSGREFGPSGGAQGLRPAASGNSSEGRLLVEQGASAQLASGAAEPGQGAQERRDGDPLSVVHIFVGQLAARLAADRQRSEIVAIGIAAAVEGAEEQSGVGGSGSAVEELAGQLAAATPQDAIVGERHGALGATSSTEKEVAGERAAASLQSSAQDQRHVSLHASSAPVPQLAGERACGAVMHCGAGVQHQGLSASSSTAAGPADGPAGAVLGRAANNNGSEAGVAEYRVPAAAPQELEVISAAAAVAALQGPLPAATRAAEQPHGTIPRLLAWLDAPQPGGAQRARKAEASPLDAAHPEKVHRANAAKAQRMNAAEPDQVQRASAEEAVPPADGAAHAALAPESTRAADPSHMMTPVPAFALGAGGVEAAYPQPGESATSDPAACHASDDLGEGSGAGSCASPTAASPESVQHASSSDSALAASEAWGSRGLSSGHRSPGLPASPGAAGSAAAAEEAVGPEHAVFLHVRASASSQGSFMEQPLRSPGSSAAASVAEEEWLQSSPATLLEAPAAAPASPAAAATLLLQPGTPDAQRALAPVQLPAHEAASAAPAPCLAATSVEAGAGEMASAAPVSDVQGGSADAAARALVCLPAPHTAAGPVDSPLESGNAAACALHEPHLRAAAAAQVRLSSGPSPSSSPGSGGGVRAAASAGACEAVQGAAGEGADGEGGLSPSPDGSPAVAGSGDAPAAPSVAHTCVVPATQALSEQHVRVVADRAASRASRPAASQAGGAPPAQHAHAADSARSEATACPVADYSSPAPGSLSMQQADNVAAALLQGLLADATAEMVSAAVQALGDASSADAAARLGLNGACARSPCSWAPPPPQASGVLHKERPGSGGATTDNMQLGAETAAAELRAAAAAARAVGREECAPELDLLSTESCAWLRVEEHAGDAGGTPRGPASAAPAQPGADVPGAAVLSDEAVEAYAMAALAPFLADPLTRLAPGQAPFDLEGFLALERDRGDASDAQHIVNKAVFDATAEALLAELTPKPSLLGLQRAPRPAAEVAAAAAARVRAWAAERCDEDVDALLLEAAQQDEVEWRVTPQDLEDARRCIADELWDDAVIDTAGAVAAAANLGL